MQPLSNPEHAWLYGYEPSSQHADPFDVEHIALTIEFYLEYDVL